MYFFSNYCCRYANVISNLMFEVSIWVIYLELFIVYMANFFVMHDIINIFIFSCPQWDHHQLQGHQDIPHQQGLCL